MLLGMDDQADPIDRIDRARRVIDARFHEPLSLAELARAAGLSPYHLSRQFAARFGQTVTAYIRARRVSEAAARLLASPRTRLVDLAFDSGFDSQEGFTRAFKRAFGVSPGRYGRGARRHLEETPAMANTDPQLNIVARPDLTSREAFTVAGLAQWFDETSKAGIPGLWTRLAELAPGGLGGRESYGVCWGGDGEGLNYMAALPWPADRPPPEGLSLKTVPAQTYLVFRQVLNGGPLHLQMQAAAREIWGERLPRSGRQLASGPDLEIYPPGFLPDQDGAWIEWWVPAEA